MVTDGIVKIHVHISFRGLWQGLNPNPQVNTCLQSLQQLPLELRCPNWMWPCTCCFLPQLGLPVNSRGGGPRSLGELAVETACTCWTLIACQLHDGSLCCLSVHCVQHWQYLCPGPEACTRTDAAMTLQLYVTVVRCSQTGWIETTGLKKSLGSDGTSSVKHLAWLVIPQPPRHCRPCCCFCCCCCC